MFNIAWQEILNNLMSIGLGLFIFLMSYVSNMSFSIYYNIRIVGETFSKTKIVRSLIKIACFSIGTCLLTMAITMILPWANANGLTIPEEYSDVITTVATLALCLTGSLKYIVEAVSKMGKILNYNEIEDDSPMFHSVKPENGKLEDKTKETESNSNVANTENKTDIEEEHSIN